VDVEDRPACLSRFDAGVGRRRHAGVCRHEYVTSPHVIDPHAALSFARRGQRAPARL